MGLLQGIGADVTCNPVYGKYLAWNYWLVKQ